VQSTVVPFGTLSADRDTAGVVTPVLQSSIAAPVSGIVARVAKLAGDWVTAGTVVVQLDDSPLKIALANAQAAVDTAKINLDTTKQNADDSLPRLELQLQSAQSSVDSAQHTYDSQRALFDLGGISASALDLAGGQLATAKANLESARLTLDQAKRGVATTPSQNIDALRVALSTAQNNFATARYNLDNAGIKAPFDGQIASIAANPGMFIGQNTAAFVLVSRERQVSFSIAPSDANAITVGTALSWEYAGTAVPITVKQAPSNPINGVIPITASLPASVKASYGTVGNVSYLVQLAVGTLVPLNAIQTLENRNFVYVVNNGRVGTQDIGVIAESGVVAAVTGLNAGFQVIVSPPPGLVLGTQVQAMDTPMPQVAAISMTKPPAVPAGQRPTGTGQYTGQSTGQRQGGAAPGGAAPGGAMQGAASGGAAGGQYSGQRQGGQGNSTGAAPGGQYLGGSGTGQYTGQRSGGTGQYSGQRQGAAGQVPPPAGSAASGSASPAASSGTAASTPGSTVPPAAGTGSGQP
jgi:multidrug efflux pump subunit AcrA (membrane-fusion protein)